MKNWIWIPLAALVGLMAGSWGPRTDLRLLRERMQNDRAQATRKASAVSGFDTFAKLTGIADVAKRRPAPAARPAETNVADAADSSAPAAQEPKRAAKPERSRPRHQPPKEDLREQLDAAADVWRTRVELASVQWKERLGLADGEGASGFDTAVSGMNDALRDVMQAAADEIETAGKMTPELTLRLLGDASRVMAEAYDAIGAAVPAERRADVSEVPVFEFIDPSVAEPMIGVQDKLRDMDSEGDR